MNTGAGRHRRHEASSTRGIVDVRHRRREASSTRGIVGVRHRRHAGHRRRGASPTRGIADAGIADAGHRRNEELL